MTESTSPEQLLDQLRADLRTLGDRLVDADFAGDLYRALAARTWRRAGVDDGTHVALSFKRAEEVVNQLRAEHGEQEELTLAQTGDEGALAPAVRDELGRLGWRSQQLDPTRHDPAHVDSPRDEPRQAPDSERFSRAHEEAEAERRARIDGAAGTR